MHTGVVPEHGTSYSQFPLLSQLRGVFAPHSLAPGEHATHAPSRQAGVAPPQGLSASTHSPATHVRGVCPSHPMVPLIQPASVPASISLPPMPPPPPCPPPPLADSASVPASVPTSFPPVCPTRTVLPSLSQAAKIPMGTSPKGTKINNSFRRLSMIVLLRPKSL